MSMPMLINPAPPAIAGERRRAFASRSAVTMAWAWGTLFAIVPTAQGAPARRDGGTGLPAWAESSALLPQERQAAFRPDPDGGGFEWRRGLLEAQAGASPMRAVTAASHGDFIFEAEVKARAIDDVDLRVRVPAGGEGSRVVFADRARSAFRPRAWNRVRIVVAGDVLVQSTINRAESPPQPLFAPAAEGGIGFFVPPKTEVQWRQLRLTGLGRRAWLPLFDGKGADLPGLDPVPTTGWRRGAAISGEAIGVPARLTMQRPLPRFSGARITYRLARGTASLRVGGTADGESAVDLPLPATNGKTSIAFTQVGSRIVNSASAAAVNAPPGLEGRVGLRLAPGAAIEVDGIDVLSDPVPPRVPGFPVGRCVRVVGVQAPEEALSVGFEYVELALQDVLPLPEVEKARLIARMAKLAQLGLPSLSGYGFVPPELMVVGPRRNPLEIEQHLEHGILLAKRLGLGMVVFGNLNTRSRSFDADYPVEKAFADMVDFGKRAGRIGERLGVDVLIEPLPPRERTAITSVQEGVRLIEAVANPRVALLVDFGFMVEGKEDLSILTTAARHIRQIEMSNPAGRVYPRRADEADYASFFRALAVGKYRGGFSVHAKPDVFFADAPRALGVLRQLAWEHLAAPAPRTRRR